MAGSPRAGQWGWTIALLEWHPPQAVVWRRSLRCRRERCLPGKSWEQPIVLPRRLGLLRAVVHLWRMMEERLRVAELRGPERVPGLGRGRGPSRAWFLRPLPGVVRASKLPRPMALETPQRCQNLARRTAPEGPSLDGVC
eukprot:RCo015717